MTLVILLLAFAAQCFAGAGPDPRAVARWNAGWRHPQAGWIVVHIEGEPYERGLQHGHLLAPEIAGYVRALAEYYGPQAPALAWDQTRRLVNALFLRGFTAEQLEEMKGIAEGAAAEGAKFGQRPIDLVDVAALNAANELDSLDQALDATPTGVENLRARPAPRRGPALPAKPRRQHPQRCSAFAAVGPATRDGKIVFGHITMFDLYPANYYNVWIDIQPSKGYRFAMQTSPGGMHSGMDYSINAAGILLSETTLDQTALARAGIPLAARIRNAEQYADSIEKAAEMLTRDGNGLSTTEWILADIRRNEIALLTLGTNKSKLYRSSRNEWIADAPGFYWSDNNIKDLEVRLQTIPGVDGQPSALGAYAPSHRDAVWLRLYDSRKGTIDADFGRQMLTTPEIVAAWAVDAKYTTSALAAEFETWASFGPPVGAIWRPSAKEQQTFSAVKPLLSNPWTILGAGAPQGPGEVRPVDRPNLLKKPAADRPAAKAVREPAWHGTVIPAGDADIWLTTAFANYERIVGLERDLRRKSESGELRPDDRDELGVELSYYRSIYAHGARAGRDFPLADTHASVRDENWYGVATGKGVLLLHTLRGILGAGTFDRLMDQYGSANAGKPVTAADFEAFLEKGTGRRLSSVFDWWLHNTGLPHLAILGVKTVPDGGRWKTTVGFDVSRIGAMLPVPVTVETGAGEETAQEILDAQHTHVTITTDSRPERVIADKYGLAARNNGPPFTILTFDSELEQTLIAYGTSDEETGNREAARSLQQSLRRREHNIQPAMKPDREVSDQDLRSHHVVLVGRPATNSLSARFADRFPVRFGTQSFDVRDDVYADPESAVIAAIENPLNPRYSMVLAAGLSGLGTLQVMPRFEEEFLGYSQVVVLPHGGEEDDMVAPVKELTRDVE
jgi:hypothetical protein